MEAEHLPLLQRLPRLPRKVAVLRPARLGDFVCAIPSLRALRAALPQAELIYIGLPRVRLLAERCRFIDRFEPFPGFAGLAEQFFQPHRCLEFLQRMQRERLDLAIQFYGSGIHSNVFLRLLGARWNAGFRRPEDPPPAWMDATLPYPDHGHETHRLLALARALGTPVLSDLPELEILPDDWDELSLVARRAGFSMAQPLLAVHPGAENATRRWPPERFAGAAQRLAMQLGAVVAITGSADERPLAERVAERLSVPAYNLAGTLSLGGLGALFRQASLVLSNDTGPAHLAYAVNAYSVTIFGAEQPERWGPLDRERHRVVGAPVSCRPCSLTECPIGYRCLVEVGVQDVVSVADSLLANRVA